MGGAAVRKDTKFSKTLLIVRAGVAGGGTADFSPAIVDTADKLGALNLGTT